MNQRLLLAHLKMKTMQNQAKRWSKLRLLFPAEERKCCFHLRNPNTFLPEPEPEPLTYATAQKANIIVTDFGIFK